MPATASQTGTEATSITSVPSTRSTNSPITATAIAPRPTGTIFWGATPDPSNTPRSSAPMTTSSTPIASYRAKTKEIPRTVVTCARERERERAVPCGNPSKLHHALPEHESGVCVCAKNPLYNKQVVILSILPNKSTLV